MTDPTDRSREEIQGTVVACLAEAGYEATGDDLNYGNCLVGLDVALGNYTDRRTHLEVLRRKRTDGLLIEVACGDAPGPRTHRSSFLVSSPQAHRNMIRNIAAACVTGIQVIDPNHRRIAPKQNTVALMERLLGELDGAGFGTSTWPSIDGWGLDVRVYESNSDTEFARIEAFADGGTTLRIVQGTRIRRIHTDSESVSAHRRVVDAAIPILEAMLPPLIVETEV